MLNKKSCKSLGVASFLSLFLVGCQTGGEDTTPGLKGIDSDRNGIRDDIDVMIAQKYSATPAQRDSAKRLARTMQVLLESQTAREASINYQPVSKALGCMFLRLEGNDSSKMYDMLRDIEAMLTNTRERFKHYWDLNRMMSGSTINIPSNEQCESPFDAS